MPKSENKYTDRELLIVAFWWHAGLHSQAPDWVLRHPMWPKNNDGPHPKGTHWETARLTTPFPARDRLWEAIAKEYGIDLKYCEKPKT